jgi:hypothetical protein
MLGEDQMEDRLRELRRDPRWSIAAKPDAEARIRAAARRHRLRAASAGTAVIAALTIAIVVPLSLLPNPSAADSHQQGSLHALDGSTPTRATIMIDPQIGETFAPAPASAAPELTAQQAWARFERHLGAAHTAIPSGVHVQLGLFTLPAGPNGPGGTETYVDHDALAYGYSSPSGCVTLNPRLKAPPNAHCIFWTFLNANTGVQIESTYQKIGHWHWLYNSKGL